MKHLAGKRRLQAGSGGMILAGEDVPPTLFLETDWSRGGAIALDLRKCIEPCGDAGARARRADGGRPRTDSNSTAMSDAIVDGESGTVDVQPGGEATAEVCEGQAASLAIEQARETRISSSARGHRGRRDGSKFWSMSQASRNSIASTSRPATASA